MRSAAVKERAVLALSNSRLIAGPAYFENEINFYELKAKNMQSYVRTYPDSLSFLRKNAKQMNVTRVT